MKLIPDANQIVMAKSSNFRGNRVSRTLGPTKWCESISLAELSNSIEVRWSLSIRLIRLPWAENSLKSAAEETADVNGAGRGPLRTEMLVLTLFKLCGWGCGCDCCCCWYSSLLFAESDIVPVIRMSYLHNEMANTDCEKGEKDGKKERKEKNVKSNPPFLKDENKEWKMKKNTKASRGKTWYVDDVSRSFQCIIYQRWHTFDSRIDVGGQRKC